MNPRRVIVLVCSVLLVLLGGALLFFLPSILTMVIGLLMMISGVSTFAKTI